MTLVSLLRPGMGNPEQDEFLAKAPPLDLFATLAHSPVLARRFAGLGAAVMMEGALSPELREIAALRVAYRCNAPYVLAQHQRVARQIGMSEDKVMQSQCEEGGEAFAPLEQRVLALVDVYFQAPEMVANFDFSELTDALDERQIVELLVTIGYFAMVAIFTTGLQLDV